MKNQSILKIKDIQQLKKLLKEDYFHEKIDNLNFFENNYLKICSDI